MDADRGPRYVCSRCGYSRASVKRVVEHIDDAHGDDARVMEQAADAGEAPLTRLGSTLRRMRRLLRF